MATGDVLAERNEGVGQGDSSPRLSALVPRFGLKGLFIAAVAGWQAIFFVLPLLFLVAISFWTVRNYRVSPAFVFDNWEKMLSWSVFHRAFAYTLQMSTIATVLTLLIALPAAYVLSFALADRAKKIVIACLVVPVFSSYLLRVYAWQIVLSPYGIVNSLFGFAGLGPVTLLGTPYAMLIGILTISLPPAILVLVLAMNGLDTRMLEAARNLGATPARVAFNVVLPGIRQGVILAGAIAFILAFSDFVSPVFMTGSQPPTLSILIVDTVKSGAQWPRAAVVGISMLAVVIGLMVAVDQVIRRSSR